jgi:hypothetical protein
LLPEHAIMRRTGFEFGAINEADTVAAHTSAARFQNTMAHTKAYRIAAAEAVFRHRHRLRHSIDVKSKKI